MVEDIIRGLSQMITKVITNTTIKGISSIMDLKITTFTNNNSSSIKEGHPNINPILFLECSIWLILDKGTLLNNKWEDSRLKPLCSTIDFNNLRTWKDKIKETYNRLNNRWMKIIKYLPSCYREEILQIRIITKTTINEVS